MIQLSDVPWMTVAWLLGLLAEGTAWGLGFLAFSPALAFWIKVVGLYAALGYMSFLWNRSPVGFLAGGLIGVAWELVNLYVYPMQSWRGGGIIPSLLAVGWCALVPGLADRILDPWLMRGSFRWLASHHPRYDHLRK